MTPKPKDMDKSSALVIHSEPPTSPVSAIDLANRFAPFGSKYLASYSSTLAAPYDLFVDVSQKSKSSWYDLQ
jgi:hypothetical protein